MENVTVVLFSFECTEFHVLDDSFFFLTGFLCSFGGYPRTSSCRLGVVLELTNIQLLLPPSLLLGLKACPNTSQLRWLLIQANLNIIDKWSSQNSVIRNFYVLKMYVFTFLVCDGWRFYLRTFKLFCYLCWGSSSLWNTTCFPAIFFPF